MRLGSAQSCAMHQTADGSASTISGAPLRAGSRITIPLAVPMQSRIPGHLVEPRRIVAQRIGAGQRGGNRNLIVVEPAVGSTPPWAGVTPAPSDKKSQNGEDAILLSLK